MNEIKAGAGLLQVIDNLDVIYFPPSKEDMEKIFKELQKQNPPKDWVRWF